MIRADPSRGDSKAHSELNQKNANTRKTLMILRFAVGLTLVQSPTGSPLGR